ncbi:MAG: glycosyltransferase family 9 protein [Rhodocyclaceae bacterium]|nr:glycosyltransferase family 9 protein [Rhodocyclaceae bacterium]
MRESLLYVSLRCLKALDRRRPDPSRLGTPAIERILAISSTALGDTLLSTPGLRSLRLAYPQARISLLSNAAYIGLFATNPDIDEIIPYAGGYRRFFRLARELRKRRFDLAVIFHGNEPQATPLAYFSGASFIFKLPNANRFRFLLTNRDPVKRWEDLGHGIDQRLEVAALAGGVPTDRRMVMPVLPEQEASLDTLLARAGIERGTLLIGLQPGASTASRRWSPENFAELGRRLLAAFPEARVVLTGSPAERKLAEEVASGIASPRTWVAAGRMPLELMPAFFRRLAVLVTGDTGPMHLAVAVGTSVVALFAVSDWHRSGPAYDLERHFVIQKARTCDPCLSKRCSYVRPPCMANISVDEVEKAVCKCLAGECGYVSDDRSMPA